MVQQSPNIGYSDDSSQVLWEDGERVFSRGWRLDDNGNRRAVLLVAPVADHPSPSTLDRLTHEYELKDELDRAWAAQPLALMRDAGRTVLVLNDQGGEPLDHLLGGAMEVGPFLTLAIGVSSALGKLHQRGLIHKDIKPANVVVNCSDGRVRLTGFGIASRLSRERQAPEPPETIAGTLAYMAPEQTGRMNRSIDARSDLYALGITLYQMLTGVLPLTAADPMEWVHCHIARKPVPPGKRRDSVPAPVSAIIMKLLAKTPEDRYQTAAGVERDLRRCLAELEERRQIDDFPIGQQDTPNQLLIPEKLYGRDREIATLLSCFDRITKTGVAELVLVSGYSGIGKSSVVDELHKVLVQPRGLFAFGKFDQYKRDIPYATLVQAFQGLIRPLLSKSDMELASWRHALLEALGSDGRLMADLIPELKLIIGDQPSVPELPPQLAKRRFQLVFRRFISVFARANQPLALFLDDLQWLDAATLDLLEDLVRSDIRYLMLVGAYRDNDVTPTHPLMKKIGAIKTANGKVVEIKLPRLDQEHVGKLVADALRCAPERAAPLAKLLHVKTDGNPFFAIQFLSSLVEEGLLAFDHDGARWSWDIDRIHAKGYTDNVVDLMVGKLARLPVATQNALQQMACLGNIAESTALSLILGMSEEQLDTVLWPARHQEMVERAGGAYRFVHDRVQEAAYALIPERLRGETHLRIGRLLAARASPKKGDEATFEIVNQLNRAVHLIESIDERERAAEFNLAAGLRANSSTAYVSALSYFVAGRSLLAEDCWERRWELIFTLDFHRAECELLTGALSDAESHWTALSARVTNVADRAVVARLGIDLYIRLNQSSRAVAVGLEYLNYLGINWSPHPTDEDARTAYRRIWSELDRRTTEELKALPVMTDPASLVLLDVLNRLSSPAQYTDFNLYTLAVCEMLRLTLDRGNSDASAVAYARFGMIVGLGFGEYEGAYRVGQLAYELVEERALWRFQAGVYLNFGNLVMPWRRHIRTCCELMDRAFDAAQTAGDLVYAGICFHLRVLNLLTVGDPLADIEREADRARSRQIQQGFEFLSAAVAVVRMLRGKTVRFGSLNYEQFDEQRIERDFAKASEATAGQCLYWICKLQARFMAGDYAAAIDAASRAQPLLSVSLTIMETADYHFYSALSYAAFCDATSAGQQASVLDALNLHHRQLASWAAACPENFADRASLVGAEIARIDGRAFAAMNLYEQAIRSAQTSGFVHNEALARELAARFHDACGFKEISHLYMRNARDCYLRWGADGKVRQLDATYTGPRLERPTPDSASTIAASVEQLDLATVIKVSQAVSSEIVLEKLLEMLMRTALEQAGAERGLLILSRGTEQRIAAEATTDRDLVAVHLRDEEAAATVLPESVLHYVLRTRESVILDDASSKNPFSVDPYIVESGLRSMLCLPLINQGRLTGILYLENNLTPGVFTPDRVALLRVLASQAAISLQNSRLYRDIEDRERKIRRLVDSNIIGIIIANREGRILEANDAFLRILGYEREELISGRVRWTDLSAPEWRERDTSTLAELNSTGIAQPFEKEYLRKDGSRVPVLIGATLFKEGGDEGLAFVLDLTERKRIEEALSQAQRLSRTGNWIYDATTMRYIYWSDESYRIWGFDPAQGLPSRQSMWERIHPEDRDRVVAAVGGAVQQKTDFVAEFRLLLPDGTIKWVEGTSHHMFSPQGTLTEVITTTVDVTERRRAQDEREKLRQLELDFAHMNRVSMMGELAASLSHEITQPIASARNNARAAQNFLKMQPPDMGEVIEALACVVQDTDRAGNIIDRMRAHVNKAPLRMERFDFSEALNEMVALARSAIIRYGVSVQTRLSEGPFQVHGDRIQLQQVLLNLILNAAEAMDSVEAGVRELLISAEQDQTGGVLVAVRDSGPGIDPAHLDRVFDAFYTTKSRGTGMGLSICRSIINAHGGKLWAEANKARGAVFQFTLPGTDGELTSPLPVGHGTSELHKRIG
jgi:PAS domain S-box-containing protein